MDANTYNIHDIAVSHENNGTTTPTVRIEYSIGKHGPFVHRPAQGQADAASIKAHIQAHQQQLMSIGELES